MPIIETAELNEKFFFIYNCYLLFISVFSDFHVSDCEAFEAGGGHGSIKLIENR